MAHDAILHEIRTPLQLIACCARLIWEELPEGAARTYAETMLRSVDDLQKLLTFALEDRRAELQGGRMARHDLVGCVREAVERFRPAALRRNIELVLDNRVDRLDTAMDAEKFRRVALNLLSNAVKFTPDGGKIVVKVTALGDTAQVDFIDNGCGIASERLDAIFSVGESDSGYGFGLPVARRCAEMMSATLTARSEVGKGSAFSLRMPVRGE